MSKAAQRASIINNLNNLEASNNSNSTGMNKESSQTNRNIMSNTLDSKLSTLENNINPTTRESLKYSENNIKNNTIPNKNINLDTLTTSTDLNEEKQKFMMQTLNKMFNMNSDISNGDNSEKNKKLQDLMEKVENYEKENLVLFKQYKEKEKEYEDKIKGLERQLLNSDKADIVLIQKQNKDYEIQINNLNKNIQSFASKYTDENLKFKSSIKEITSVKDQLQNELDSLESLKKEIIQFKKGNPKKNDKAELVVRYNDPNTLNKVNNNINESNTNYQVIRSTRSEFENK